MSVARVFFIEPRCTWGLDIIVKLSFVNLQGLSFSASHFPIYNTVDTFLVQLHINIPQFLYFLNLFVFIHVYVISWCIIRVVDGDTILPFMKHFYTSYVVFYLILDFFRPNVVLDLLFHKSRPNTKYLHYICF